MVMYRIIKDFVCMATKLCTFWMMLKLPGILYVLGCIDNKPNWHISYINLTAPLSLFEFQISIHDHDISCPMASGG